LAVTGDGAATDYSEEIVAVTEAPEEIVEVPRAYRWMSRYGPVLLCIVGAGMVLGAMLLDKPDAVLVTLIVMGVGSLVAGVLLPPNQRTCGGRHARREGIS
jgi:hypothetical protein